MLLVLLEKHFDILGVISSVYALNPFWFHKNIQFWLIQNSIYVSDSPKKKSRNWKTAEFTQNFCYSKIHFIDLSMVIFPSHQAVMSTSIRDSVRSDFWKAVAAVTLKSSSQSQHRSALSAVILVSISVFKRLFSPQSSHNFVSLMGVEKIWHAT